MKGKEVIDALKKKFRAKTDAALAERIGVTVQAIQNWKNRRSVTARQIAGLSYSSSRSGSRELAAEAIQPVVEFFPIDKSKSKQGAKWEVFGMYDGHPYRRGVRDELEGNKGIYIFFDSRGQAIYTGKTHRQTLWKEINLAFNRDRGEVQKIKRVRHPSRRQGYKTSEEKARQIVDYVVPLHDLAAYFSAYAVADGLIAKIEAMLVRSFANDLLNVRMEKFAQKASKRKKKKKKRR